MGYVLPMSQTTTDLWGRDIALDANGQAKVAANGELVLTDGPETGEQDIRLRLFTRLGTLFYDTEFGSLIHDWILEESTEENRAAFCAEVLMRVEADPVRAGAGREAAVGSGSLVRLSLCSFPCGFVIFIYRAESYQKTHRFANMWIPALRFSINHRLEPPGMFSAVSPITSRNSSGGCTLPIAKYGRGPVYIVK